MFNSNGVLNFLQIYSTLLSSKNNTNTTTPLQQCGISVLTNKYIDDGSYVHKTACMKLDPIYNIHNSADLNLGALTKSAQLIRFHRVAIQCN